MKCRSDAGVAPKKQRKVMTLQEKVELLDVFHRLGFAVIVVCHFKINKSSKDHCLKKERMFVTLSLKLHQQTQTYGTFCEIPSLSCAAFRQVQVAVIKAYRQTLM